MFSSAARSKASLIRTSLTKIVSSLDQNFSKNQNIEKKPSLDLAGISGGVSLKLSCSENTQTWLKSFARFKASIPVRPNCV